MRRKNDYLQQLLSQHILLAKQKSPRRRRTGDEDMFPDRKNDYLQILLNQQFPPSSNSPFCLSLLFPSKGQRGEEESRSRSLCLLLALWQRRTGGDIPYLDLVELGLGSTNPHRLRNARLKRTNRLVERLSLNRSQCGGCSTRYDTPTKN